MKITIKLEQIKYGEDRFDFDIILAKVAHLLGEEHFNSLTVATSGCVENNNFYLELEATLSDE